MLTVRKVVQNKFFGDMRDNSESPNFISNVTITGKKNSKPSEFPTINLELLGEPQTGDDLEGKSQNYVISTYEVKSYTNTKLADARENMDKAGNIFISMGFKLITGPEDISDGDINIMVARFRRLVGNGDLKYM